MFDKDRFIQECRDAVGDGPVAINEIVAAAVSDQAGMLAAFGEPVHAGITPLYNAAELTIIHFVWAPCMALIPHNHRMFGVVGIYSGREDNIFWQRTPTAIKPVRAESLGAGELAIMDEEAIHSVLNPIEKMTCAIHVYGGDFFHPKEPRSEWDHETLVERPWNVNRARALFHEAEARFNAAK